MKSKGQILLQDVDPNNIPEDLDVIFQNRKKLVLVGRRMNNLKTDNSNIMKVEDSSFEEKSLE